MSSISIDTHDVFKQNQLLIYNFMKKIMTCSNESDHINLLKIYPIFKNNKSIISVWKDIYNDIIKKQKFNNSDKLFDHARNKFQLLNFDRGNKNLSNEKNNLFKFLYTGLSFKYIQTTKKMLAELTDLFERNNEDQQTINMFNLEIIKITSINKLQTCSSAKLPKEVFFRKFIIPSGSARPIIMTDTYKDIMDIEHDQLAMELTRIFTIHINNMNMQELALAVICKNDEYDPEKCPELYALKEYFNMLCYTITKHIICQSTNDERIRAIIFFIKLAKSLDKYNNLHGMYAVFIGLTHHSLQRIKPLWNSEAKHTRKYNDMASLFDLTKNSINYRNYLNNIKKKVVPYIGLITSDIKHLIEISIIDHNNNNINMEVYNDIIKLINSFEKYKNYKHHFMENKKISDFIKNMLDKYTAISKNRTDLYEDLYAKSLTIYESMRLSQSVANISNSFINMNKDRLKLNLSECENNNSNNVTNSISNNVNIQMPSITITPPTPKTTPIPSVPSIPSIPPLPPLSPIPSPHISSMTHTDTSSISLPSLTPSSSAISYTPSTNTPSISSTTLTPSSTTLTPSSTTLTSSKNRAIMPLAHSKIDVGVKLNFCNAKDRNLRKRTNTSPDLNINKLLLSESSINMRAGKIMVNVEQRRPLNNSGTIIKLNDLSKLHIQSMDSLPYISKNRKSISDIDPDEILKLRSGINTEIKSTDQLSKDLFKELDTIGHDHNNIHINTSKICESKSLDITIHNVENNNNKDHTNLSTNIDTSVTNINSRSCTETESNSNQSQSVEDDHVIRKNRSNSCTYIYDTKDNKENNDSKCNNNKSHGMSTLKRRSLNFNLNHTSTSTSNYFQNTNHHNSRNLPKKIELYHNTIGYEFIKNKHVQNWSVDEVCLWLKFIKMEEYMPLFAQNKISGFSLVELKDKQLKNYLGIKILGDRITILKAIQMLNH